MCCIVVCATERRCDGQRVRTALGAFSGSPRSGPSAVLCRSRDRRARARCRLPSSCSAPLRPASAGSTRCSASTRVRCRRSVVQSRCRVGRAVIYKWPWLSSSALYNSSSTRYQSSSDAAYVSSAVRRPSATEKTSTNANTRRRRRRAAGRGRRRRDHRGTPRRRRGSCPSSGARRA